MKISERWLVPGLLVVLASFAGSTFATWYVCLLCFGISAAAAKLRRRRLSQQTDQVRISRLLRWLGNTLLYLLIALLISAWRFGEYAGETINPIAFGFDAVAHAAMVSALILWVIHPIAGHPAMLGLGLLVVLLCVAAGGASHSFSAQLAVALAVTIGFVLGSNCILGHRYHSKSGRLDLRPRPNAVDRSRSAANPGSSRIGILFSLLVLSAILMTTTAIAHVTEYVLPGVKTTLHSQLTNSIEAVQGEAVIGSTRYVRGSRIGSIRRHMLGNPASMALRAYATATPGYLRGTAFDRYSNGRWSAISFEQLGNDKASPAMRARELLRSGQGLTRLEGGTNRPLTRFFTREPDDDRVTSIEIHNDPMKGPVIFTPLATRWLEANASSITISHHDIVQAGINVSDPYVCGAAKTPKPETLDPKRRQTLLTVPADIRAQVSVVAQTLCAADSTAFAKAKAISQYFQENFEYSLTKIPTRSQDDPISQFLTDKHPAHCEYFATASVLLLRSAGVPARYVTGYVTIEKSEEDKYWIARNRDAHAWVEAYDDLTGQWFPVESTPGRIYLSMRQASSDDGLFDGSNSLNSDDRSDHSLLSLVWGWLTSMRTTDPLILIFRFGQLPLFCVVAFLLWKNFRGGYKEESNPMDVQSRQMLRRIDRRVKRHALIRQPHETLHQFASRIETALETDVVERHRHQEFLARAAQWYRQYAAARYRGQMPVPFQL